MKKIGLYRGFALLLTLALLFLPVSAVEMTTTTEQTEETAYLEPTVADETSGLHTGCYSVDATTSMHGTGEIIKNAKSVFLYEVNTQTLMYALNPDMPLDPSSLVKIMTGLIALEKGNLTEEIMVKQSVLDLLPRGAVSADLQAGEYITLENLLYCMIVGSANDACVVIADHIAGSQEAFVALMNQRASELGCTATNFTNTHGIYSASQTMSARDVAKVLSAAIASDDFNTIFNTVHYTVPATNKSAERNISSNNFLCNNEDMQIYYDSRVKGGRAGVGGDGTRAIAVTAEDGGMRLISVLMGAESVIEEDGRTIRIYGGFPETKALLDAGFSGYKSAQILFDGQALVSWDVAAGENAVTAGPKSSVYSVLPADIQMENLDFKYDIPEGQLQAPISAGDRLCAVEIWYGNICVAKTDVYAMNDVRLSGHWQQKDSVRRPFGSAWLWAIVVICVLVVVAMIVLRLGKGVGSNFKNKKKKIRRIDRRRAR